MHNGNKARFGLTMDPTLLKIIDAKRGLIPRATYIEHCLKQYFELEGLKAEELSFHKEIGDMLLKLSSENKRTEVLRGINLINSKIAQRREALLTNRQIVPENQ